MKSRYTDESGRVIPIEPFFAIKEAAEALGLKYHQLQRGIKSGVFPAYIIAGRPRVRLSEVIAVIEASKIGDQAAYRGEDSS
ncbi:helix-turn-helix domain-containing protein [Methylocystis sp. WRRC1]|uniref:helix-turn-helix domain-containing protein n=1 Tax=Methylocystis sp. WRRC1 TaxID=1732014 RepID=UPI001D156861|nr:helix-turn-helix domain-containing protein [Methylocystis sp. WRRC1]MCC3246083.1 helix-turn-helix domain-containing protein [Methylocystis sp. WRRC1]